MLIVALPPLSAYTEHLLSAAPSTLATLAKWFIFYTAGLRLFLAGLRQSLKPAFIAKTIFHLQTTEAHPVIRELGFANLCFGLIGLISLFQPTWRPVSAFASGLYYALAALLHITSPHPNINEKFALYSDILIFLALAASFITITTA